MQIYRYFISVAALLMSALVPTSASTEEFLKSWLRDFKPLRDSYLSPSLNPFVDRLLLDLWEQTRGESRIKTFRNSSAAGEAVRSLIPFAAGGVVDTRKMAAVILADVVDEKSVCYLISFLKFSPEVDPSGRLNLLRVIAQVSHYAPIDTAEWISQFVAEYANELSGRPDVEAAFADLQRIPFILANREQGKDSYLRFEAPAEFDNCLKALGGTVDLAYFGDSGVRFSVEELNNVELLRDVFFSADRRKFANFIVNFFNFSDEVKKDLVGESLLSAIIQPGTDERRRYRVNLYIAYTFSLLPAGAVGENSAMLEGLKDSAEYRDSTFKKNVDLAVRRQIP